MTDLEKRVVDKKLNAIDIAKLFVGGLLVYDPVKKKILVESEEKKELVRDVLVGGGLGGLYYALDKYGIFDVGKRQMGKLKDKINNYGK